MERNFTTEEKKKALEFAYSMGLERPEAEKCEDFDFAHAMGLWDKEPIKEEMPKRVALA